MPDSVITVTIPQDGEDNSDEKLEKTGSDVGCKKKGALSGVFIPTCENMWGVLIFLRFNFIVGHAGIGYALLAVFMAFFAAFFTTVSLSACVSSGGLVSRGGPYYVISRATGPIMGASVGLMYWLGITLLAVLETLGAVETIFGYDERMNFMVEGVGMMVWGSGLLILMVFCVYGGVNVVTKLGIGFFVVVGLSILSFYVGFFLADQDVSLPNDAKVHIGLDASNLSTDSHFTDAVGFGSVLSVFMPCFTGILSGANRSDILRNPARNIIQGTFGAICFSLCMYVSMMFLWGAVAPSEYLRGDLAKAFENTKPARNYDGKGGRLLSGDDASYVLFHVPWNPFSFYIYVGIIISSIAQALQCLIVAPKLLQNISADDVIPGFKWFAKLSKSSEPTRALLFTYCVAAALVIGGSFAGGLDFIAPILSTCFLIAYTCINASCLLLTLLKAPSWRPFGMREGRYRMMYISASFCGMVVCLTNMFVMSWIVATVAIIFGIALFAVIGYFLDHDDWGSVIHGIQFHLAWRSLLSLEKEQSHEINWRPHVLTLFRVSEEHDLLKFYSMLSKGRGICIAAGVMEGDNWKQEDLQKAREQKIALEDMMKEKKIKGLSEVIVTPHWADGFNYCIQISGIGGLKPNTVLIEWPESVSSATDFVHIMSATLAESKALLVVKGASTFDDADQHGVIDVWWMIHDGGLLILTAYLLRHHRQWRNCKLRIFTIMERVNEEEAEKAGEKLTETLRRRKFFNVQVKVVMCDDILMEQYHAGDLLRTSKSHLSNRDSDRNRLPLDSVDLLDYNKNVKCRHLPQVHVDDLRTSPSQHSQDPINTVAKATEVKPEKRKLSVQSSPAVDMHQLLPEANRDEYHMERSQPPLTHTQSDQYPVRRSILFGQSPGHVALSQKETAVDDPDEAIVVRICHVEAAKKLNAIIQERSASSALVILNLPDVGNHEANPYMSYVDTLIHNLDRVVLVHSAGNEVFEIDD